MVKAKDEAGKLKAAGEHAIGLAMRDTVLSLEDELVKEFRNTLTRLVKGLLADPARRAAMAEAMRRIARPQATADIVREMEEVAAGRRAK